MTIGIDIRVLGNSIKSGIEEYTEQLLRHMLPLDQAVKYKLFYSSHKKTLPDFDWLKLPNVEIKKFKIPNRLLFNSSRFLNWPFLDEMLGGVDVFFSPHFLLASLSEKCKRVTTFHDLSYLRFPHFFSLKQRFWHQFEMRPGWQSRFSEKIIAVSDSTKQDIIEKYQVDPARIEVIYSGVAPEMKIIDPDKLNNFRRDKNLPQKFILYLGKLEPRKNVVGIIRAFNKIKDDPRFADLYLVVGGSEGWLYEEIFREAEYSAHRRYIKFVGHMGDGDRPYYYNLADVFVYPSFFEGFGLPPLEAMACGTPVVASNNSSLPEVVGNGGILVDPYNISEAVFAIKSILLEDTLKNTMVKRGLERAQQFSWEKCAGSTLDILVK